MRCNVGVNPKYLLDQHLLAEYRELPMVVGSFKANGWQIKSPVSGRFGLGYGHINFFKLRLLYLAKRHDEILKECSLRGFNCTALCLSAQVVPVEFCYDWKPTLEDSMVIRERIVEKIIYRHRKTPGFWRHYRVNLTNEERQIAINNILHKELYFV